MTATGSNSSESASAAPVAAKAPAGMAAPLSPPPSASLSGPVTSAGSEGRTISMGPVTGLICSACSEASTAREPVAPADAVPVEPARARRGARATSSGPPAAMSVPEIFSTTTTMRDSSTIRTSTSWISSPEEARTPSPPTTSGSREALRIVSRGPASTWAGMASRNSFQSSLKAPSPPTYRLAISRRPAAAAWVRRDMAASSPAESTVSRTSTTTTCPVASRAVRLAPPSISSQARGKSGRRRTSTIWRWMAVRLWDRVMASAERPRRTGRRWLPSSSYMAMDGAAFPRRPAPRWPPARSGARMGNSQSSRP